MNERAIKLYEEATEFAYKTVGKEHAGKSYFQGVIAGKFAELIVRECIDKAFHNGHPDLEFLLKHFGVKE